MGTTIMPDNMSLRFDYYYGNEAEQFTFIRVPKIFLKDKRFSKLSSDAKLLYGILLDRMQLSIKNQWIDDQNRVYIIYKISEIMEDFDYSNKKSGEMLNELHKFGIIEKVRRGQGKPDLIYVKNFIQKQENLSQDIEGTEKKEVAETLAESGDFQKCKIYTSRNEENGMSRNVDSTLQEVNNLHFKTCKNYTQNKTDINYNNINNTDLSINLSTPLQENMSPTCGEMDGLSGLNGYIKHYRELVRQNIEYDALQSQPGITEQEKKLIDNLYEIICDVVCIPQEKIMDRPYAMVQAQFLRLNAMHIKYVLQCMKDNTGQIKNIRNYVISTLLNADQTMNLYYQQKANQIKGQAAPTEPEEVQELEYNFYNRAYLESFG